MMNGTGPWWDWQRGVAGEAWAGWRGSNSGFDQSVNSATRADTPMQITGIVSAVGTASGTGTATGVSPVTNRQYIIGSLPFPVQIDDRSTRDAVMFTSMVVQTVEAGASTASGVGAPVNSASNRPWIVRAAAPASCW